MIPPPCNSMEAYLLLEAARSDRQICLMCKDLACEVIHCNTIALQVVFVSPSGRVGSQLHWSMQCARLSPHIEVLVSYLSFSYNYALTKWYAEVASSSALDVVLD